MNLKQLQMVAMAVRCDFNLTTVAQKLFTTQPAVSRGILDLEAELGVRLFERHGKRLTGLTEQGEVLEGSCNRILSEIDNIQRMRLDWRSEDIGKLLLATTHTQARYTLPLAIGRFRQQFPRVQLQIHQGSPPQNAELLQRGDVDFAVATEGLRNSDGFETLPICHWRHVLVVPLNHVLALTAQQNRGNPDWPSLAVVADQPLIVYDRGYAGRSRVDTAFEQAALTPEVVIEATDADVIKTYVQQGMGVGILPSLAYDPVVDNTLVAIAVGHLFGENTTWLAYRSGRYLRRYEQAFILACNDQLNIPLARSQLPPL